MLTYITDIIMPFVERVRDDLGTSDSQAALTLYDHFKGQLTGNVMAPLEKTQYSVSIDTSYMH